MERLGSEFVGTFLKEMYAKDAFTKEIYPWNNVELLPTMSPVNMSGQIEVIGLSGAGKTEFIKYAKDVFRDQKVNVRPELVTKNEFGEFENWGHGTTSLKLKGLMLSEYGPSYQMMVWNQVKLISHLESTVEQAQNKSGLIIERGCNDVFATTHLTQPEHYSIRYDPVYQNHSVRLLFESMFLASRVDAVILFGTDWETTKARRIASKQQAEGRYVNSKVWEKLVKGYEIWLGSFYPLFKRARGMGLLVIDGKEDLELNNKKAIKFCEDVFAMKNS